MSTTKTSGEMGPAPYAQRIRQYLAQLCDIMDDAKSAGYDFSFNVDLNQNTKKFQYKLMLTREI